jgi:hypothetical protein
MTSGAIGGIFQIWRSSTSHYLVHLLHRYEMPTLDDAQKESTAGVAASRQPRGSGVAVAVAALGGGVTPTASRLGSLLARSDGGSALSEGGVTFMLPDVTTATGAMYAQMDEKDFDQVSDV